MNILFVCTMNQWRSRTAETIFKNSAHAVQSAGTSDSARIRVNQGHIKWADRIFVMETKHKQILQERFEVDKPIVVLHIPDAYMYMDPELIEILRAVVGPYL